MTDHVAQNRRFWDSHSDEYQAQHAGYISPDRMAWGVWQVAEDEVRALPEVDGKDALELGCGACQWSIALARRGARGVGLDFSDRKLEHARRLMAQAGVDFPLVHASAEDVPLPSAIDFQLGYGDWIRLFAANGLHALDPIELRPPADAVSSYRSERSRDWARRWPMDHIWQLRKL